MFSIDFAAQDLYTDLACHKSPHQPTSLFMKSPFQLRCYTFSSKLIPFSCLKAWNMTMRVRRPLKGTLRKIIWSYVTQSKKVKKTRKPKFFSVPVHVRNWIKAEKDTKIQDRVKEGDRIKREGKLSHPRMRDPGEIQAGQRVTENKRSDSLELCLQRSAFLEMANQEKTDSHTNIVNWWLRLKYTSKCEKMIFVCVCEFSDRKAGKEAKRWAPEWEGMWGPKSWGNRPSGPQLARE